MKNEDENGLAFWSVSENMTPETFRQLTANKSSNKMKFFLLTNHGVVGNEKSVIEWIAGEVS